MEGVYDEQHGPCPLDWQGNQLPVALELEDPEPTVACVYSEALASRVAALSLETARMEAVARLAEIIPTTWESCLATAAVGASARLGALAPEATRATVL